MRVKDFLLKEVQVLDEEKAKLVLHFLKFITKSQVELKLKELEEVSDEEMREIHAKVGKPGRSKVERWETIKI